jgi:hypothetical protein
MLDEEVEILLREIREGVKTRPQSRQTASAITHPLADNGDCDPLMIIKNSEETLSNASRLDSYLTTTGRAWDRLPPIASKRAGAAARLEIWLKSRLKTLTRWFTWEQVNFNAAVHHALRDVIQEITEDRRVLDKIQQAIQTGMEHHRAEIEELRAELEVSRTVINSELRAQQNESERQSVEINAAIQEQARLMDLIYELRKQDEQIQAEQRVCFRQFALEQSETVALRRRSELKVQVLLEELGKRIEALEQGTKRS